MPRNEGVNDAIITSLRFKRLRTMLLFYGFIALMPLGCVCPCALGSAINHETTRTVLFVTAFILPLVGLAGTMLMTMDLGRYGKMLAVARAVDALGFVYTGWPKEKQYGFLRSLRLFSTQTFDAAYDLFEGEYRRFPVTGLRYSYSVGVGRYQIVHDQTVLVLHDAVPGVPNLVLSPRGLLEKIIPWLSGHRIELPDAPEFNKQFSLAGGLRQDEIADHFTPGLIELCEADPALSMEVFDGDLIVCRQGKILRPEAYEDFLDEAVQLAKALRGSA
jgi:hypothetical protein